MFQKARIKLTAWYLIIIMLISILFSLAIYKGLNFELTRIERAQRLRQEFPHRSRVPFSRLDPEVLAETRKRISLSLIAINLIILGVSGGCGYFLAARTLKPIKEMIEEQNRFITDASHELRTPLTALKTATEVGLRDKNLNLAEAKDLLRENLDEINRLQALSGSLLRLAQFESVNGKAVFTDINLSEVFEEAEKRVSHFSKSKKIKLSFSKGNYLIRADKHNLIELIVILLDNAIKYSLPKSNVNVLTLRSEKELIIEVADQGIGIDNQDIPYIFDRFYRTDKARLRKNPGGYGLGLSIAKKIVETYSGSIEVKSILGKGTTFKLFLRVFV